MKNLKSRFFLFILVAGALAACQRGGTGPTAWIDQPLDEDAFPVQLITLQSHASDPDGVASIEFFVDDQSLLVVSAGGNRLGQSAMEWMPPGEGSYTISVKATDNTGNIGEIAYATITITAAAAEGLLNEFESAALEPESEDDEENEIQIMVEPELPEGPFAIPNQTINCRSGAGTAFDVIAAIKGGRQALIIGRLANNSWLLVEHMEKDLECWVSAAIVEVSGDLAEIPIRQSPPLPQKPSAEEEPAPEPPAPQPEEKDTTPPVIASVWASPAVIYQQGCTGETQATVLYVETLDIGGIKTVEATWTIGSESGSSALTFAGNSRYQATLGPFTTAGTLTIYGSVVDSSGNWTPFTINVTIKCCIC